MTFSRDFGNIFNCEKYSGKATGWDSVKYRFKVLDHTAATVAFTYILVRSEAMRGLPDNQLYVDIDFVSSATAEDFIRSIHAVLTKEIQLKLVCNILLRSWRSRGMVLPGTCRAAPWLSPPLSNWTRQLCRQRFKNEKYSGTSTSGP